MRILPFREFLVKAVKILFKLFDFFHKYGKIFLFSSVENDIYSMKILSFLNEILTAETAAADADSFSPEW